MFVKFNYFCGFTFFFVSFQSTPYTLKDGTCNGSEVTTWTSTGLPPSTGYYTYDPTFGAYG